MFGIHGYWLFVLSAILLKIAPGQDTPLNPKVALFFLAFLPQFVDVEAPAKTTAFVALGLTFVATGTVWVLILAVAAAQLRRFFERQPRAHAWISRAMGGIFVFLGVRLAISER